MDILKSIEHRNILDANKTHIVLSVPLVIARNESKFGTKEDDYDPEGAMLFIVVTVSIYSLGIVAFVFGHISRKSKNLTESIQTSEYISTFNTEHLNNLSKLYMLRCMQGKMLARYHMLSENPRRNIQVNKMRCQRGHAYENRSTKYFPRIFQDITMDHSVCSENSRASCYSSSDNFERVTNCSDDDNSVALDSDDAHPKENVPTENQVHLVCNRVVY